MLAAAQHGAFFTLREGARHMVARAKAGDRGGSLIACGSLSMFLGVAQGAHYAAAKSAVGGIIRALAVEMGPYGVRANVLAAGYIETDLLRDAKNTSHSQWEQYFIDGTPLGRLGTTADVEGAVAYLASDASSFHTGDTLVIDGGYAIAL
jgi:NAD(P)-dependent dehydrogenase (short-subunit alcohol dehydrogenase family)